MELPAKPPVTLVNWHDKEPQLIRLPRVPLECSQP